MKRNKFPGNVLDVLGVTTWCHLGVIIAGLIVAMIFGAQGWVIMWNNPPSDAVTAWDWFCVFLGICTGFAIVVTVAVYSLIGLFNVIEKSWKWMAANCKKIKYED